MIVVTHMGKIGDMMLSLPVASALSKREGQKIHYAIHTNYENTTTLLLAQEFIDKVSVVPFPVDNWGCGGQPFVFNPNDFGIECDGYYNIGLSKFPDKYVPAFYGEAIGTEYDRDFVLYIEKGEETGEVLCDVGVITEHYPEAKVFDYTKDVYYNVKQMVRAKEAHCWFSGMAVILDLANVRFHLWQSELGTAPANIYFRESNFIEVHRIR